jgi:uncharacterized low-complexity protein
MSKKSMRPIAAAISTAVVASLASISSVSADQNPFGMSMLSSGYMVADAHEGKCGEGKCGEKKQGEGKCGEGKCGEKKQGEGKCGEGKCGGSQ